MEEGNRVRFNQLSKFMKQSDCCPNKDEQQQQQQEEYEELELSLGLSMNGRFGVDPTRSKRLKRSSSISNFVFNGAARGAEVEMDAPLVRTRSLPTETEEEWRRRKELESMRRMEARRKRMEKLKSSRVPKDVSGNGKNGMSREVVDGLRIDSSILRRFENGDVMESCEGPIGIPPRSGSSGSSDLIEGPKQNAEVSPSSRHTSQEQELAGQAANRDTKIASESLKNGMLDMPYVTTKETGPNGRKIEGFLYRYKKGEDVRIVCVCHGLFLTPKEFIEHGGGGDVEHPLKHIVVNPFPLL